MAKIDGKMGGFMAARKKGRAGKPSELIISKARTKAAVKKCNVGGEFYGALDSKTLKAVDL
jgi:hypothetical protein